MSVWQLLIIDVFFFACTSPFQQKAPIDVADALKLLSGGEAFQSPLVRKYAVDVLRKASDEELHILLLQLVQALRYEPVMGAAGSDKEGGEEQQGAREDEEEEEKKDEEEKEEDRHVYSMSVLSPLGRFLVERACSSTTGNTHNGEQPLLALADTEHTEAATHRACSMHRDIIKLFFCNF